MLKQEKSAITYNTLLAQVQNLEVPVLDFVNHLRPFTFEDEISHGAIMTVYKSLLRRHSRQSPVRRVALKVPNQNVKENENDGNQVIGVILAAIYQEIRIMKHFEAHPYIINLYGISFQELKPILVVELATASLCDYLVSRMTTGNRVGWKTKARFCYEVAEGIKALHTINMIHGDIKAESILLFGNPKEENELIPKLSGFGYSSTVASVASNKEIGGTPNFWAPECTPMAFAEMKPYANKSTKDNYSYGLYVWQVATDGEIPYEDMDMEDIDEAKHSDRQLLKLMSLLPEDTPESFKKIIVGMTQYEPTEREDLVNVRAIMSGVSADYEKSDRHTEMEDISEVSTKILPRDISVINFKLLRSMPIPPSIKKRLFRIYEVAASKGDAEAAYVLSICYGSGFGVNFDKIKMISWAIQAAKGGNLEAVKNIASSYVINIEQLPENRNQLFPWILQTAEAGHKESQVFILQCYETGVCVEKDIIKQKEWKTKILNNSSRYGVSVGPEESLLHSAAREGNIEAIKFFIQHEGMCVNTSSSGIAPLHLATLNNHVDVINSLVEEFGADVNIKNIKGWTPLHFAAAIGNKNILKILTTKFGADVNVEDNDGMTPLHLAAQNGRINTVKLLVAEFGANANAKKKDGWTPLHLAARNGHIHIVKFLVVGFGADVNVKSNTGWTPLHLAAFDGYVNVVKLLVAEFGADVNIKENQGYIPLHFAAQNGHIDIVKLLMEQLGADMNISISSNSGQTPLHLAAMKGHIDIVKLLVNDFGADINVKLNNGWTPFHLATENRHVDIMNLLIELGADINAKSNSGWTPLHSAAYKGYADIVKLFVLGFGADVNAKNKLGWTPLHLAARGGRVDTVKLLIDELEADINSRDCEDQTPLIFSGGEKCKEVALALSEHPRTNIYAKTENGQTLLHLAVKRRQEIVIKILVEQFHLDIHAKDSKGRTPLELVDDPPVHDYICDGCEKQPVVGELRICTVCEDFGFCSTCYSLVDHFNGEHIFKIIELPSVKYLLVSY